MIDDFVASLRGPAIDFDFSSPQRAGKLQSGLNLHILLQSSSLVFLDYPLEVGSSDLLNCKASCLRVRQVVERVDSYRLISEGSFATEGCGVTNFVGCCHLVIQGTALSVCHPA